MSQADFADAVGAANGALVARWEKGQAQPDYGTLAKIATMGVVDVLVFHDSAPASETPQLAPGEANELRDILMRMESLLDDARRLVDRASSRTALQALEAAAGSIPARTGTSEALVLDAEVRLETKPRSRTASAGRRSTTRATPSTASRKRSTSSSSSTRKSGSTAGAGSSSAGDSSGTSGESPRPRSRRSPSRARPPGGSESA